MEGAEDVPRGNPIKKVDLKNYVNMAVCSNFKAYLGESDGDQALNGNWPTTDEDEADVIPETKHKEIQKTQNDTPLMDEDVCQ